MEIEERRSSHTATFIITVVFLAAMAAGLTIVFVLTINGAVKADEHIRRLLARLAWLSLAMLGLTVVMLFWVVTRFFMQRMAVRSEHSTTPYVDAWSLAGKRVKPVEDDSVDEDEEENDQG